MKILLLSLFLSAHAWATDTYNSCIDNMISSCRSTYDYASMTPGLTERGPFYYRFQNRQGAVEDQYNVCIQNGQVRCLREAGRTDTARETRRRFDHMNERTPREQTSFWRLVGNDLDSRIRTNPQAFRRKCEAAGGEVRRSTSGGAALVTLGVAYLTESGEISECYCPITRENFDPEASNAEEVCLGNAIDQVMRAVHGINAARHGCQDLEGFFEVSGNPYLQCPAWMNSKIQSYSETTLANAAGTFFMGNPGDACSVVNESTTFPDAESLEAFLSTQSETVLGARPNLISSCARVDTTNPHARKQMVAEYYYYMNKIRDGELTTMEGLLATESLLSEEVDVERSNYFSELNNKCADIHIAETVRYCEEYKKCEMKGGLDSVVENAEEFVHQKFLIDKKIEMVSDQMDNLTGFFRRRSFSPTKIFTSNSNKFTKERDELLASLNDEEKVQYLALEDQMKTLQQANGLITSTYPWMRGEKFQELMEEKKESVTEEHVRLSEEIKEMQAAAGPMENWTPAQQTAIEQKKAALNTIMKGLVPRANIRSAFKAQLVENRDGQIQRLNKLKQATICLNSPNEEEADDELDIDCDDVPKIVSENTPGIVWMDPGEPRMPNDPPYTPAEQELRLQKVLANDALSNVECLNNFESERETFSSTFNRMAFDIAVTIGTMGLGSAASGVAATKNAALLAEEGAAVARVAAATARTAETGAVLAEAEALAAQTARAAADAALKLRRAKQAWGVVFGLDIATALADVPHVMDSCGSNIKLAAAQSLDKEKGPQCPLNPTEQEGAAQLGSQAIDSAKGCALAAGLAALNVLPYAGPVIARLGGRVLGVVSNATAAIRATQMFEEAAARILAAGLNPQLLDAEIAALRAASHSADDILVRLGSRLAENSDLYAALVNRLGFKNLDEAAEAALRLSRSQATEFVLNNTVRLGNAAADFARWTAGTLPARAAAALVSNVVIKPIVGLGRLTADAALWLARTRPGRRIGDSLSLVATALFSDLGSVYSNVTKAAALQRAGRAVAGAEHSASELLRQVRALQMRGGIEADEIIRGLRGSLEGNEELLQLLNIYARSPLQQYSQEALNIVEANLRTSRALTNAGENAAEARRVIEQQVELLRRNGLNEAEIKQTLDGLLSTAPPGISRPSPLHEIVDRAAGTPLTQLEERLAREAAQRASNNLADIASENLRLVEIDGRPTLVEVMGSSGDGQLRVRPLDSNDAPLLVRPTAAEVVDPEVIRRSQLGREARRQEAVDVLMEGLDPEVAARVDTEAAANAVMNAHDLHPARPFELTRAQKRDKLVLLKRELEAAGFPPEIARERAKEIMRQGLAGGEELGLAARIAARTEDEILDAARHLDTFKTGLGDVYTGLSAERRQAIDTIFGAASAEERRRILDQLESLRRACE